MSTPRNLARQKEHNAKWRAANKEGRATKQRQRLATIYADPVLKAAYQAQQKAWRDKRKAATK